MRASQGPAARTSLAFVVIVLTITMASDVSRVNGAVHKRTLADQLRYGPGATNHPVHVVPSTAVRMPEGWPRAPDGSITCLTCHTQLPAVDGSSAPRLRDQDDDAAGALAFCAKCHRSSAKRSAAAMHWMAVGVAHVKSEGTPVGRRTGLLNSESRRCMGCHDGVTAGEAANTTVWNRGPGSLGDSRRNHPVGMEYARGALRRGLVRLRPVALLPSKVRLPAGQVGCVSCHDLYAADKNRLTVPIDGSALCFSCHEMD